MSKTKMLISIPMLICLTISGCKNTPAAINTASSEQYDSTDSTSRMSPEELWANYGGENSSYTEENDVHITSEVSADYAPPATSTIKSDPYIPEDPDFAAYEYKFIKGGEYRLEDLMPVFFGEERMKSIVPFEKDPGYHGGNGIMDDAMACYYEFNARLQLNESGALGMNIFDENRLDSAEKMNISITEDEAIALCDKFLSNCNITGYKYDVTEYFGAVAENYYTIRYYYQLPELPSVSWISDRRGFCYLTFDVTDDGIVTVLGGLFDEDSIIRGEGIEKAKIISPQKALQYAAEQADVILNGLYAPVFKKYYVPDDVPEDVTEEGLLLLSFCKIELSYWFKESGEIELAWIFYMGENGHYEKNATFAIDALSGKVCDH